jgi:hypothetical protein
MQETKLAPEVKAALTRSLIVLNQYDGGMRKQDATHAICEALDGTILSAGRTYRDLESKFDFFTQATREDGTVLWRKFYGPLRSGGDALYRAGHLSEQYWRNDIAEAICADGHGNCFVTGPSTLDTRDAAIRAFRDYGAAVVSYNAAGALRWATKIPDFNQPRCIAAGPNEKILVLGVGGYRRRSINGNPLLIYALNASDGKIVRTQNLGVDRHAVAIRVLPDGNIRAIVLDGRMYDFPDHAYRHSPMKRIPGSWLSLTLTPDLKVIEKIRFDAHDQHVRKRGAIAQDGTAVTIESYPDETDRLSCWRDGKQLWQHRFPLPQPDNDRRHQRCDSPISISAGTVFVARGDGPGGINGAEQSAINRFDLVTGQPLPDLLTPIYPKGTPHWAPEVIYATPTRVLVGGESYGGDAWVGVMPIPPTSP